MKLVEKDVSRDEARAGGGLGAAIRESEADEERRVFAPLLELFQTELQGVSFPGADAMAIAGMIAANEKVAIELREAEVRLLALRTELSRTYDELLAKAHRALAYAKVYAEDNFDLAKKVNAISLPRVSKSRNLVRDDVRFAEEKATAPPVSVSGRKRKIRTEATAPLNLTAQPSPDSADLSARAIDCAVEGFAPSHACG